MPLARIADVSADQWDALLPEDQPFLRHGFLLALEESGSLCARRGWQSDHLLWLEQGSVLAAIPSYRKTHSRGEYVFDQGWAEACHRAGIAYNPKWLGAVPFGPVTGPRLIGAPAAAARLLAELPDHLARHGLSSAHINFTDSCADRLLDKQPQWLMRLGCQYHWHNRVTGIFRISSIRSIRASVSNCAKSARAWPSRGSVLTGSTAVRLAKRSGILFIAVMPIPMPCAANGPI